MASNQSLGHNPNYASQIRSARPQARTMAENVGYSGSARSVFDRMAASSGHRANMVNGAFSHQATGCSVDSQGRVWVSVNLWG